MIRSRALAGRALARPSILVTSLFGLSAMTVACSAPPGGETAASTSQGISYSLYPPTNVAAFGAADLANAYNIPTYLQANTTIAIITGGDDPNAEEDLDVYRSAYGLPPCSAASGCLTKVTSGGATTGLPTTSSAADTGEITSTALDMASAGCPSCKLLVVEMTTGYASELLTAVNTAKARGASAMIATSTWSDVLDVLPTNDSALAQPGVTVFAGVGQLIFAPSGNTPASSIPSSYPAESPNVIAVGQTNLTNLNAPFAMPLESAMATGDALCTSHPKPSWQKDTGCSGRTANDVAALGGPVWTFNTFNANSPWQLPMSGWMVQGAGAVDNYGVLIGPIIASSLVAAIFAQTGNGGAGPSYPYSHTAYFNDVTTGSVVVAGATCAGYVCNAGVGYDGPTGVGTPDGMDMALVDRDTLTLNYGSIDQSNPFLGDQGTGAIVVSPGLSSAGYSLETSTTWASGCALSVSYTGLPQGVSGVNVFADGSKTEPGMSFELSAATNTTLGQQTTMTVAATACGVTHYTQTEVLVQACVPTTTCATEYATCGSIVDNCGNTLECGTCATGLSCKSNSCLSCVKTFCSPGYAWNAATCECALEKNACACGGTYPSCKVCL
jgi:hypothetical protein